MTTGENETKEKDKQRAEKRLQDGIEAYNDGKLDKAAEAVEDAEIRFRLAGDFNRARDSRSMLADIQRLERQFNEAETNYQLALETYRAYKDVFGIIDALLGLGRIYLDQGRLDKAADTFAEAFNSAQAIEYELGAADSNLGLAEVNFLTDNVDQALIAAQAALQEYSDKSNALGTANANRLLAEINMRRAQLSYANSLMHPALRTYKSIAVYVELAKTLLGLAEIQRRRGFLERAIQSFQEARQRTHSLNSREIESKTLLGLGDSYLQEGQIGLARNAYTEAATHLEAPGPGTAAIERAEADVRQARLPILTGNLKEAETLVRAATDTLNKNSRAARVTPQTSLVSVQLLHTISDFMPAEASFARAR